MYSTRLFGNDCESLTFDQVTLGGGSATATHSMVTFDPEKTHSHQYAAENKFTFGLSGQFVKPTILNDVISLRRR